MNDETGMTVSEVAGTELIARGEIDQQITTAKKYPRSIKHFVDEATAMVTLTEDIAQQCIYALLRWDGKKQENVVIEGPSARFAEIIACAWRNCRAGARIVNEGAEFITAQGAFHDLERNVAITFEVPRRITTSAGKRYSSDMIGVTGNAASSIALRNAILKGVPKAFWDPIYKKARAVVAGNISTLSAKRTEAIKQFAHYGISEPMVLQRLGRPGIADVTVDDLVLLFGLLTAIKDGDTTPEEAFPEQKAPSVTMPQAKSKAKAEPEQKEDPKPEGNPADTQQAAQQEPEQKQETAAPAGDAQEQTLPGIEDAPKAQSSTSKAAATDGEKTFIRNKCNAAGVTLETALEDCGLSNFDALTKDGFVTLRDYLNELTK